MEAQASSLALEDYSMLEELRVAVKRKEEFCLCLWLYIRNSAHAPATIIRQVPGAVEGEAPFLALHEDKKIALFPLVSQQEDASNPIHSASRNDLSGAVSQNQCPLEKWIHIGCEVTWTSVRLHIDGVLVGEKPLSSLPKNTDSEDCQQEIALHGNGGKDGKLFGYVHHFQLLPVGSSVRNHLEKDPPVELSLDSSCFSDNHEVEEGGDGVWSVVGGKASCRRNFSLDVVLVDALGRSVNKEMQLIASLVYADDGSTVEKPKEDADAPLLISYDGIEYPSTDRAVKLLHGRASFKLKISQLSSKSDGRLFRVRFHSFETSQYPFLEACSRPIHCISRSRTTRPSSVPVKRSGLAANPPDRPHSSGRDEGSPDIQSTKGNGNLQRLAQNELKDLHSPKRVKLGHDKSSTGVYATGISEHPDDGLHGHALSATEDERLENLEGTDTTLSDSESVHTRNLVPNGLPDIKKPVPDVTLFKYCLEGMHERSMLLRDIATSAGDLDIEEFAKQVSLYTGCFHHRSQITAARGLILEGAETWNAIPRNTHEALWKNAAREIERRFLKISRCSRGLSGQDMEILRRMAGSRDSISREDFDRLWCWLYPIANALSKDPINAIWECTSPKWIEGLITKEEAEASLRGTRGLHKSGTFILRFPTSRSWPHPDAGNLVVTYVGDDFTVHHRLLSLGESGRGDMNPKPPHELLFVEPELSQLGRVVRQQPIFYS